MVKNKNSSISHSKVTTIFGYGLFALTVLSFIVSTVVPLGMTFASPSARYANIIVILVTFAVATILPALASYFIGDKATHAKSKPLHHYNGVLFGITAYWVAQLFSWLGFSALFGVNELASPMPLIVANIVPVILTIALMIVVAVAYAKQQKRNSTVLQYRPFQIVLIASVVLGPLYPYFYLPSDIGLSTVLPLAASIVLLAVSYKVLARHHTTRLARLSDAIIAASIAWITAWLANSLMAFLQLPYGIWEALAYAIGLVVFVAYLFLRIRKV